MDADVASCCAHPTSWAWRGAGVAGAIDVDGELEALLAVRNLRGRRHSLPRDRTALRGRDHGLPLSRGHRLAALTAHREEVVTSAG